MRTDFGYFEEKKLGKAYDIKLLKRLYPFTRPYKTLIIWSIILVVAAIGIGNLMMVSVHMRTRQIAVLRAVGAVKSQIIRLILAEAATLGLLGLAFYGWRRKK